jgi:hypothetical protein
MERRLLAREYDKKKEQAKLITKLLLVIDEEQDESKS